MAEPGAADTDETADDATTVVPEACRTQAAELAWSIDHPAVELDDLDDPDHHRASWRRVAVIGAVIVAAAAVAAGGIIAWDRHGQPPPAPVPATAAKPAPTPEKPPAWHLDGTYRIDIRNAEGTMRNGATGAVETMGDLGVSTSTVWQAWETECTPTNCTARTVALDDVTHQHADGSVALFRWDGIEWESTGGGGPNGGHTHPVECGSSPGVDTVESWGTMSPLPDGSFRGTFHRTKVKAECPGSLPGDQQDVPMVAVRIGDAPPGVFE